MQRILHLNDYAVKSALNDDAIRHLTSSKRLIGRGMFSLVYEGSSPDRVLKVTSDSANYWMHNCYAYGVEGIHFAKVFENYGDVGEIRIGVNNYPIYAFEVERLEKIKSLETKRTAKFICNTSFETFHSYLNKNAAKLRDRDIATASSNAFEVTARLIREKSKTLSEDIRKLADFCANYDNVSPDNNIANFMIRPETGDLVINDPILDLKVHKEHTESVARRHYRWG